METIKKLDSNMEVFEEVFKRREKLDLFGTPFEILDISPENLTSEIPVLIAPGWGETIDTFKDSIRVLYENGRRVLCLNHPRKGDEMEKTHDALEVYGQEEEMRKPLALIEVLNDKIGDKADVIAHSEGGINTAIAATLPLQWKVDIIK